MLDIIKTEVLEPALSCETLSAEIKESVKNTLILLEAQESAEGIIAFFADALKANRGKRIKEELEKNKLKSFEMIESQIFREYYC